jgi:threonine/homoserine/homoserine lactone efflux protein
LNPIILQAAQFGVSAGTNIGPLHTLLMNATLTQGWRYGLLITLTPLLTDIPIIILMLFVLSALPPAAVPLLNIVGGLAVFLIAYTTFRGLRNPAPATAQESKTVTRDTLLKSMTVNFLNPGPYIYWGTITGPLFLTALNESLLTGAGFLLSFYGTFLGLMAVFVLVFDRLRGVDERLTRTLTYISLVILVYLGTRLIVQGVNGLSV